MKAMGTAKAPLNAVSLSPTNLTELEWQIQKLQLAVARRAFELFEARNREHGHDWEDWFRAESELLRPVSTAISESKTRISVRANVLGFEAGELKVSVAPDRILILGAKHVDTDSNTLIADRLLHTIELPVAIQPDAAQIQFESGVLRIELPKADRTAQIGPKLL